jgi:ribosomal protein S12 methylthiotransferase
MGAILDDALRLQDLGVRELILIAQDTTDYGSDLGLKDGLVRLLENLLPVVTDVPWVRLMYAYPGYVRDSLIDIMCKSRQLLPYLDIPLQHASAGVLKAMKRPANMDWVRNTIGKMRERIPALALRTTFITGFPAETEKDYQLLLDFVSEIEFDHIGVFPYSYETGTTGASLGDPIPEDEKLARVEGVMKLQESISLRKNQAFIGKHLDVLIEGYGDGVSIGRSYRDAPEIDGLVIIEDKAEIGKIVPVNITGALVHDLIGRL